MKKIFSAAALVAGSFLVTPAMAKDVDMTACTKDGKTAILHADVAGYIVKRNTQQPDLLEDVVRHAFTATAASLPASELASDKGKDLLLSNIAKGIDDGTFFGPQFSNNAKIDLGAPVVSGPACTPR